MTRRGWLLFLALSVIWGIPYLLIKVAVSGISPALLVFGRTAVGCLLLLPMVARRRQVGALLPRWRPVALFTVIEMAVQPLSATRLISATVASMSQVGRMPQGTKRPG